MQIYLDTANIEEIKRFNEIGIIDGVTTNPTLISKEVGKPFIEIVAEITAIVTGPVSVEAVSVDTEEIIKESRILASIAQNIAVKIPTTFEGLQAIKTLSQEGIKTNATLVFSPNQALLAAKVGATYVSPFIGRLDDIGIDGMLIVEDILNILNNFKFSTQVIVASIRHPKHVQEAARIGAHIATVPSSVLEKMIYHPLTTIGINKFLADWEKVSAISGII